MNDNEDVTAGHHRGNPESVAAHDSVTVHKARLRRTVINWVARRGDIGATSDEVEGGLALPHQTVSARITEAKRTGELVDSGRRRPTRSGRSAAVYVAPEGEDVA